MILSTVFMTGNGLFFYDIAKRATAFYRGRGGKLDYFFFEIANAANGQIVCAAGDGIAIFNKRTKSFKVINSIANLFSPNCVSITCINSMVWIGSEAGILNYDLDTHLSARAEHETRQIETFATSPFMLIRSDLVFGLPHGFAWFNPGVRNISMPSDPIIERVLVNNRPVLLQYASKTSSRKLVFDHSNNSINIGFTAFLYADPDHINFRYRLSGGDPHWQYAEDQRSANYAQLAPGDYTFYVQSGDKNGVWNQHLALFNFIITPPYWETWWFRTLVILVIALTLYKLYRYRIKNILAIERIRERIASDFHDDIGSALSSISIFSEVADKQLKEQLPPEKTREVISHISFHSRAMLEAMDDIIWTVNPQNDHLNDLAVRMREFAIPLLEARDIQFDIDIDESILNTRIKMEVRKNIFLVFKECVNNILKHSGCTAMKVAVIKVNNQLELTIGDNGKGFDINAPHRRNGLKNMQKRADEINGTIHVKTAEGKGTVTRLLINII
jgi:two-component sensor histidine kinase